MQIKPEPQTVAPICWLGSEMFDVSVPEHAGTHWQCSQHCPCNGNVTYVVVAGQLISTSKFEDLKRYMANHPELVSKPVAIEEKPAKDEFATFQRNCPHPAWDFSHAIMSTAYEKCLRCGRLRRIKD